MAKTKKTQPASPKFGFRIQLMALADNALEDRNGKLSIIGIFDKIFVNELPSRHLKMSLIMTFVNDDQEDETAELKIVTPSGKEVAKADLTIAFQNGPKSNMITNFENFPIEEIGVYKIQVTDDGEQMDEYLLEIIQNKVPDENGKRVIN